VSSNARSANSTEQHCLRWRVGDLNATGIGQGLPYPRAVEFADWDDVSQGPGCGSRSADSSEPPIGSAPAVRPRGQWVGPLDPTGTESIHPPERIHRSHSSGPCRTGNTRGTHRRWPRARDFDAEWTDAPNSPAAPHPAHHRTFILDSALESNRTHPTNAGLDCGAVHVGVHSRIGLWWDAQPNGVA
jgi:hypothetical protein